MPFNGVGVFTRVYQWVQDAANGIFVDATRTDTDSNDIAAGLTNCVTRDGQSPWLGNLPAGGFKITGLANGSAATDSVNYGQVFSGPTINNLTGTGTVNFAGATTVTVPTVAAGDNSTKAASTAFVVAQAFAAALPAQTGNADKVVTTNGSVASWTDLLKSGTIKFADSTDTTKRVQLILSDLTTGQTRQLIVPDRDSYIGNNIVRSARTSNTILSASDNGTQIDITTNTFTQTITAAATLKNGWWCIYRNIGTGVITLDPNGGELIDGATTVRVPSGHAVIIECTGTAFVCQRIGAPVIETLTSGTSWTPPAGVYNIAKLIESGAGGSGRKAVGAVTDCGGAAGGYLEKGNIPVSPATAYTYAIGAGGASQTTANTNGNNGGNTTFTVGATTYTANGGQGGNTAFATGGTATNGDINVNGGNGWVVSSGPSIGGNNPLSSPSVIAATASPLPGNGPGGGGTGCTSSQNSGAGIDGFIQLVY